jgi:hypothetical protein
VRDPQTGQDVVLSDADVDIIQRLQAQKIPDATFDDAAVSTFNICKVFISFQLLVFLEHLCCVVLAFFCSLA